MNPLLSRLSFRSAGESHGPALTTILEGVPRGLTIDFDHVNGELRRRQGGAGRGGRQRIESDTVEITAGVRCGVTIGSPLCLVVQNRDHKIDELPEPTRPRPGHADLSGAYRYDDHDIRGTLERASARETAARVAAGAICAQVLRQVDTEVFGFVRTLAGARLPDEIGATIRAADLAGLRAQRDGSKLYTLDPDADKAMAAEVAAAGKAHDTVGGIVEVHGVDVLPGVGSHLQWHERLSTRLVAAVASIHAFKGAEVGLGFGCAALRGSEVHDEILPAEPGGVLRRTTNRAGGLEGGTTNGENVVVRGAMKPISTLRKPLRSVDLETGQADEAGYERSDVCALSAASVVAESMVAIVLADAVLARVGGESIDEFVVRHAECRERAVRLAAGEDRGGKKQG